MIKAVFLDRDGVINIDKNYVSRIEDFEFIPGSLDALKKIEKKGYLLFIITNQSGIGRNYYSEKNYLELRNKVDDLLKKEGIKITEEMYCPHHPKENCKCRKPSPHLIMELIGKYNIDKSKSYMIGDKTSDIKSGLNAKIKTILVKTGKAGNDGLYDVKPDFICEDLLDASDVV